MDDKLLQQCFAELQYQIKSNELSAAQLVGIVALALAKQLDVQKLALDIAEGLRRAKLNDGISPIAIAQLEEVLGGVEAAAEADRKRNVRH